MPGVCIVCVLVAIQQCVYVILPWLLLSDSVCVISGFGIIFLEPLGQKREVHDSKVLTQPSHNTLDEPFPLSSPVIDEVSHW